MKKYIIISICFLSLFSSCDEDFFDQVVEVDVPEHTPALAVTANMNNSDTIIWVYVSNSVGILEKEDPEDIIDATVELYKEGSLFQTIPHNERGFYTWDLENPLGDEEIEYELKVSKTGFESVSSTQTMPSQINIVNATYEEEGAISPDGDRVDEFIIEFNDEDGVDNYYRVEAKLIYTDQIGFEYSNSIYLESFDPNFINTGEGIFFTDALFQGDLTELRLTSYELYYDPSFMMDGKIAINLINITKERYFREVSIYNYEPDNPFAEPTVVFSNFENGYGIFSLEAKGPDFVIPL